MSDSATRYRQMQAQLFAVRKPPPPLDPARVVRALTALGCDLSGLGVCVHIGGTNGKGSCAAFVEAAVRACGLRTGLFTSPHLERFAERMQIDGQPADEAAILEVYERMRAVVDDGATFFEQITIMGLTLLAAARLELSVIEVGLGGIRDATSVIAAEVACITGVALDHQDVLGHDLREIAREKAGIFKPGQRVVIGRSGLAEAVPMLIAAAEQAKVAAMTVVHEPTPADLPLGLAGEHQRDNAAAALAVLDHLVALRVLPNDPARFAAALAHTRHPGRLERVADAPTILLDGAHNPHGAVALARALAGQARPRVLILGVAGDKQAEAIVAELCPLADRVIVTAARHPRSRPATELAAIVAAQVESAGAAVAVTVEPESARALDQARAWLRAVGAEASGTIVVTGSLFLVGEVRGLIGARARP